MNESIERQLTTLQRDIVGFFRIKRLHKLAKTAESCWKKGQIFYVDSRLEIKGLNRVISEANSEISQSNEHEH